MIKGINRQVVEVSDTGSEYFEKIMFFVKPEYVSLSEGKIKEYAGRIAATSSAPPKAVKRGRNKYFYGKQENSSPPAKPKMHRFRY